MMPKQRYNEGTIEALSSPSRARVYVLTDFAQVIVLEPASRKIWVIGVGNIQIKAQSSDDFIVVAAPNSGAADIWETDIAIKEIGTLTTVPSIIVWD